MVSSLTCNQGVLTFFPFHFWGNFCAINPRKNVWLQVISAGPRGEAWHPPFLIFRPNWGTKGRKCFFFWRPALLLVSGSESRTSYGIISIKFSSTRLKLFISMYKSLTVKRIKCKLIKLSHFKYPSAWWDILYFLLLYFFYLVQANPVNSDIEGPWKVAM